MTNAFITNIMEDKYMTEIAIEPLHNQSLQATFALDVVAPALGISIYLFIVIATLWFSFKGSNKESRLKKLLSRDYKYSWPSVVVLIAIYSLIIFRNAG
jgi:hypothetical protein